MSDELLDFYNRELAYFRNLSVEFAEKHPKIAGRLRLGERIEDPHVSRLIEAFAYLNARIRLKLEDSFPELCEAILSVLYPEYLAPFPSCSIVKFGLQKSQFELVGGHAIPAKTKMVTQEIDGAPCRFRTCYPTEIWPFDLASASVEIPPFEVPPNPFSNESRGMVRLELKLFSDRVKFERLSINKLRVFLNGDSRYVYDLYELIMNNVQGIVLSPDDKSQKPVILNSDCIEPVGFGLDESLIDYTARTRMGYHLLTEFFVFPQKFLFFDITGFTPAVLSRVGKKSTLCIYLLFDRLHKNLENLPNSTFQLGASPTINLFQERCEPIRLKPTQSEFRVVPDARRPLANEVYLVDQVAMTSQDRKLVELNPFYSANHNRQSSLAYWFAKRKKTEIKADQFNAAEDLGTDVYLNIVGLDGKNCARDFNGWSLDVEATCFNRDYPNRLPANTQMTLETGGAMVTTECVLSPTQTYRPPLNDESYWRLISNLSLNHLSLIDNATNTDSLKEIIRLYNFSRKRAGDVMVDGIVDIQASRAVTRMGDAFSSGFCKGTQIDILLNEEKFSGGGHYLFGSVLDRFVALYATLNSFTRTTLQTQQQDEPLCTWPARTGEMTHV